MIHTYLAGNLVCLTTVKSYTHFFTLINLIIFFLKGGGRGVKMTKNKINKAKNIEKNKPQIK